MDPHPGELLEFPSGDPSVEPGGRARAGHNTTGAARALLDECLASMPRRIERAELERDGTFHGRRLIQDPHGRLIVVAEYEHGELNGRFELRRQLPFRHIVAECRDGYFDGHFTEYWDNGGLKEEGRYRRDQPAGRYTWFERDGTIARTHDFPFDGH